MKIILTACGLLLGLVYVRNIEAETILYQFRGTVTSVPAGYDSTISSGDAVVGQFSFDSTAADTLPGDHTTGNYIGSVIDWSAQFGDYNTAQHPNRILGDVIVQNNASPTVWTLDGDYFGVAALPTGAAIQGVEPTLFSLQLFDATGSAFSDIALPLSPPNLAAFSLREAWLVFDHGNTVKASIDSMSIVPEPAASLFTCVIVIAVAGRRHIGLV